MFNYDIFLKSGASMEYKSNGKFQEFTIAVRNASDIVGIISSYVPLKKSGKNFSANCPFHLENSPSFSVNTEKQFFYCFGCQTGGDVIKFVQLIEKITYRESLFKLAGLNGIPIPPEIKATSFTEEMQEKNKPLYNLMNDATSYYVRALFSNSPDAEKARNYLYSRGLSNEDIEKYMIGYAFTSPDKFNSAVLKSKKFTIDEMLRAGLISKAQNGKIYDRFFSRIMFPIIDKNNRTIGFGGRLLDSADKNMPKYLNSPETEIYKKNSVFYGINWANDAILKTGEAILVEGYFDFIALHRAGIENVLATCGTALSAFHVKFLENKAKNVYLLFDMDEAGIRATMKNFELFAKTNINISVIKFEGAKDADEFLLKNGPEKLREVIKSALPFTKFLINYAYSKFGKNSIESKTEIVRFLAPHIRTIASDITRNQYIAEITQELGISEDGMREVIFKNYKDHSTSQPDSIDEKSILSPELTIKQKIQVDILHVIIQNLDYLSKFLSTVDLLTVDSPELKEMIEIMLEADNNTLINDLPSLFNGTKYAPLFNKLYATAPGFENLDKYFDDLILKYNDIVKKEKIDALKLKIREAEAIGDIESSKKLLFEVTSLQKEIKDTL